MPKLNPLLNGIRVPKKGFTLMELMLTVLIISIMILIAYPYYTLVVLKSHRFDAVAALKQDEFILEHCYAQNFSYDAACELMPMFPHNSTQGFYTIHLDKLATRAYTLTAIPLGKQTQDITCSRMTIDQTNTKIALDTQGQVQMVCWNPR